MRWHPRPFLFRLPFSFRKEKGKLFAFNDEEEGGRGRVDDLEFGGAKLLAIQLRKLFFDQLALDRAFGVTGIYGDQKRAVIIQKIDCRTDTSIPHTLKS